MTKEERVVIRTDDGAVWTMDKKTYDSLHPMTPDSPQWERYHFIRNMKELDELHHGKQERMRFGLPIDKKVTKE